MAQYIKDLFPKFLLDGFVERGFGCGYVSLIVKSLSFIVLRLKAKPTSPPEANLPMADETDT
jgi:hypothetical protein